MKSAEALRSHTAKQLAAMARQKGISGWHAMRKEELVRALVDLTGKSGAAGKSATARAGSRNGEASQKNDRVVRIIREESKRREQLKDLARVTSRSSRGEPKRDRVVLIVRDPYWMQAYWEITRATVQRASVALSRKWHQVEPVIRLFEISENSQAFAVEQPVRDIPVHGGVRNWFIDVNDPPRTWRVGIGYRLPDERFYLIAKSNKVTTPIPNASDSVDHNWTDIAMNHQKFFALSGGYTDETDNGDLREVFEDKLRRPMNRPLFAQISADTLGGSSGFQFGVDAEMVIYGTADPDATVTLAGEPVKMRPDGTFEVRLPLPDRRQVLPVVACSRDGTEQRTTVLAIERNTKVMEPVTRDMEDNPE